MKINCFLIACILLVTLCLSCLDDAQNYKGIQPITSLTSENTDDLKFLKHVLNDKQVVQLGESGHGMAEYFILKTRLVKYLHEELGYNVLAVEGALSDCASAYLNINKLSDTLLMKHCFYPTWNFKEALPLFSYIKETQKTDRPLKLIGFDNITTGDYFPEFISSVIEKVEPESSTTFEFVNTGFKNFINGKASENYTEYKSVLKDSVNYCANVIKENKSKIEALYPETKVIDILQESFSNILKSIDINKEDYNRVTLERMRDKLMADNTIWIANEFYPNDKVIVWAHNAHISKEYSKIPGKSKERAFKRQGEYVDEIIGDKTYTIGLYCYEGEGWAFFIKDKFNIENPSEISLEQNMLKSGYDNCFLDFKSVTSKDSLYNWIDNRLPSFEWGRFEHKIVPSNHYDGVILIKTVSVPSLITHE